MVLTDDQKAVIDQLLFLAVHAERQQRDNGFKYSCPARFLLERGRFWTPTVKLPPDVRPMVSKLCFHNSYNLAKRKPSLRYVEGYATSVIPVHHAWCVDSDDKVVDATWDLKFPRTAYFGVEFLLADVRSSRTDQNVSVLQDWPNAWPVLRGTYDRETSPRDPDLVAYIQTREAQYKGGR